MKHLFLGLLCLLVVCTRLAAHPTTDFSPVDRLAQNVPTIACESIESFSQFAKNNTENDRETVRFYFVWLAQNIHYDSLELTALKRKTSKQNPDSVFLNRKGMCRGFADLLTLLCEKSGIPARTVTGYSKSMVGAADSVELHAWNILKINNQWQLYDVTWAANCFERDKNINADFNAYFQQSSDNFIAQHFPFDPAYQLTEDVVLRSAFFNKNTEGGYDMCDTQPFCDFDKVLDAEIDLSLLEKNIKSHERAIAFMPEEKRLYDVLSYFKSEKAHQYFNQANDILEGFRTLDDAVFNKWTLKDMKSKAEEANIALNYMKNALKLYESMTFVEENEDLELRKSNMLIIHKNVEATNKLVEFLEALVTETQNKPLAKAHK